MIRRLKSLIMGKKPVIHVLLIIGMSGLALSGGMLAILLSNFAVGWAYTLYPLYMAVVVNVITLPVVSLVDHSRHLQRELEYAQRTTPRSVRERDRVWQEPSVWTDDVDGDGIGGDSLRRMGVIR